MLAAVIALGVLTTGAGAAHQTPKNGCTSFGVPEGHLISPQFGIQVPQTMTFRYWFEIESVAPANDALLVQYSEDSGASWQTAANLAPTTPPAGARADLPLSNRGFGLSPDWQNGSVNLPSTVTHVRFRFASSDTQRQGFRGWAIDHPMVPGVISGHDPSHGFETSLGSWTASGQWHVQQNPQTVSVAPGINPELVTLPDAGALPAPDGGGVGYAWFGDASTGTYCGAGFAGGPELSLWPPTAVLTSGQPHTVRAHTPHTGGTVRYSVSGANSAAGSVASPWYGSSTFTYLGAGVGQDTINAFLDLNGDGVQEAGEPAASSSVEWRARTLDDLEDPEPFVDVNVQPVAGDVFVRLPAGASRAARAALRRASNPARASQAPRGFVALAQAGKIPVGSQIDTRKGRVLLESAANRSGTAQQRAEFYFGRFTLLQRRARRPITDIVLKGGTYRGCPRVSGRSAGAARRSGRSRVRRVWGNGRGRFRTRGRYSSATVRGTKWITEDRCHGTLTRVARSPRSSRVVVRDFVRRRTVTLGAGRSYLAKRRR